MSGRRIDPSEWIEVGHVAVRTRSVLVAAKVAARVKRIRRRGRMCVGRGNYVTWMALASFREELGAQK